MSYSLSIPAVARPGLAKALGEAIDQHISEHQPNGEVIDHLDAAVTVASMLATVIGRDEDDLAVTIAGHANPGHAPTDGWADEMITISVMVRRPAT